MKRNIKALQNFHKLGLKLVKQHLGSKCIFLSHQKEGTSHYLKCVLKNSQGGKDTIYYEITKNPDVMNLKDYQELADILIEKFYDTN